MRSTAADVQFLLTHSPSSSASSRNRVKVMLYQGIYDLRDGYAGQTEWIRGLDWARSEDFVKSRKRIWRMQVPIKDDDVQGGQNDKEEDVSAVVAGFVNEAWPLVRVGVLHAGHLAPME